MTPEHFNDSDTIFLMIFLSMIALILLCMIVALWINRKSKRRRGGDLYLTEQEWRDYQDRHHEYCACSMCMAIEAHLHNGPDIYVDGVCVHDHSVGHKYISRKDHP